MTGLATVAVVGASLAGLRAVETLRDDGYEGRVVLVGAEPHLPYDRPPLSKELLAGIATPEDTLLRPAEDYDELGLELHLGRRARSLDLERREVVLEDGERLGFDGVVLATGAEPRRLSAAPDLAGIHLLRTLDDCLAIAGALDERPRVAVVGAGFIGSEVASTCRERGLDVTVLEALPVPMVRAVGPEMGRVLMGLHADHGVPVRTGAGVAGFAGTGRVEQVLLEDGSAVDADLVVVGVGVDPATSWLEDSGLELANGVVCDATCTAAPGVVAAGDVARWHNALYGGTMRVEHWTNASEQGAAAVRTLLARASGREPEAFSPVPYFWSDQYGLKIQYVGACGADDEVVVVDGSTDDRRFVAIYGRGGRIVAALAVGRPRLLMAYRRLIAERTAWDEALAYGV